MMKNVNDTSDSQKLIYGLTHDMGAPLRAVVQFSSLLTKRLEPKLDSKELYWLKLINENGEQAQQMLQSLLSYSRLTTRQAPFSLFNFDEVIVKAIDNHHALIQSTECTINYAKTEVHFFGDKEQWGIVFNELLKNALTFQNTGLAPEITLTVQQSNDTINICIEDNGIGVKEQYLNEISLPFKKLNGADEFPGIGMGLAYCEKVVELHDGHLYFCSSTLGGLKVQIQLRNIKEGDLNVNA
jgi:light-regulated signal transduction histidine kinase (bacteriophytochrome)